MRPEAVRIGFRARFQLSDISDGGLSDISDGGLSDISDGGLFAGEGERVTRLCLTNELPDQPVSHDLRFIGDLLVGKCLGADSTPVFARVCSTLFLGLVQPPCAIMGCVVSNQIPIVPVPGFEPGIPDLKSGVLPNELHGRNWVEPTCFTAGGFSFARRIPARFLEDRLSGYGGMMGVYKVWVDDPTTSDPMFNPSYEFKADSPAKAAEALAELHWTANSSLDGAGHSLWVLDLEGYVQEVCVEIERHLSFHGYPTGKRKERVGEMTQQALRARTVLRGER